MPYHYRNTYQEGPSSTVTHDGVDYQLDTILYYSNLLPTISFPVKELAWMYEGLNIKLSDVQYTDLSSPIIVTNWQNTWVVIDGFHRVAHALLIGEPTLPAKIIHNIILQMSKLD